MQKSKQLGLSNSLQNFLFPPYKYTAAQLLNLTPYFTSNTRFSLQKYRELMKQIFDIDQEKLWWVVRAECGEVEAKIVLIMLMLQLIGRERRQIGGFNQNANISKEGATVGNNLTSPRSRTTRALYISNEQTLIMHYIKDNLSVFLRLLSNEPNVEDPYLESDDLQPLAFLFKVDRNKKFSSYLPIFSKANKLKASTISEHLNPRITISEQELNSLEGLSLIVTIKEQIQCRGKDMRIIGCQESQIYIDSPVRSLYVVNCSNCTIYVAGCEHIAFIDKCDKISFTVSANLLRICNTIDSFIYYYGPSPIILTGDNRSLSIGPNNSVSQEMAGHMESAGIPIKEEFLTNFQNVLNRSGGQGEDCYSKMPLNQFDLLVLPLKADEQERSNQPQQQANRQDISRALLAPKQYLNQLENRNKFYNSFKTKIAKSNLQTDMVKNLHSALQGNFKEWMKNKGYTKNLNDLVKMLDRK